MKAFLIKAFVFVSLLVLILIITGYDYGIGIGGEKSDYMGSIVEKHTRLRMLKERKMIFAGGSNLAFGLNSSRIQDSLNVPVVNLAIHAGLGLDFILNELKHSINAGDEVVLSIEYFLKEGGSYDLLYNTFSFFPEAAKYASLPPISNLEHLKSFLKKRIEKVESNKNYLTSLLKNSKESPSVYTRAAFNTFGDFEGHLDMPALYHLADAGVMGYRYWHNIQQLNSFYEYAKQRNVKVYFMYPCYPKSQFELNRQTIKQLDRDMRQNLQFSILGTPDDFAFDDSMFFDTVYHLLREGREKRTDKVIELLKKR